MSEIGELEKQIRATAVARFSASVANGVRSNYEYLEREFGPLTLDCAPDPDDVASTLVERNREAIEDRAVKAVADKLMRGIDTGAGALVRFTPPGVEREDDEDDEDQDQ